MGRNHIHFVSIDLAADENQGKVYGGTRGDFDIIIYVDAAAALAEGVEFHWSTNGVVLSRGHEGVMPCHLFTHVSHWDWECAKCTVCEG